MLLSHHNKPRRSHKKFIFNWPLEPKAIFSLCICFVLFYTLASSISRADKKVAKDEFYLTVKVSEVNNGMQRPFPHRLHFVERRLPSSGIVVLLIHGGSTLQSAAHWQLHMDFLSRLASVCAIDLPSHGQSEGSVLMTYEEKLTALSQVFSQLSKRFSHHHHKPKFVVVGRSYGAKLALELLKSFSQQVESSPPI